MKNVNFKSNHGIKDVIGIGLLLGSFYIIGRMVGFCFSEDIWYDEVFSAGMMRYSYKEIMNWLIKGPQSSNLKRLIPEGTALHDIKVEKSCAIINLSNEFLNYGTEENK